MVITIVIVEIIIKIKIIGCNGSVFGGSEVRSGNPITAETPDAAALRAVLGTPASQLGAAIRWAARYLEG
jgi:hypothetical protein